MEWFFRVFLKFAKVFCGFLKISFDFLKISVTGEGHKTQSVLKRGLSRVEMSRTLCDKTLELHIVQ